MVYITGDTHGSFERIERFCERMNTSQDDLLIILGDAGINFGSVTRTRLRKQILSKLPITLFCIHGNHERRPATLPEYKLIPWRNGEVWVDEEFPNILFAKDGDIYDLDGNKTIVLGGAYSVDKHYRLSMGYTWYADEQPDDEIKAYAERQLKNHSWHVDVVLSHTVPIKYEPIEVFMSCIDQNTVDKSTEEWLGSVEHKLSFDRWYAGHYHTEKRIDKLHLLFESFEEL